MKHNIFKLSLSASCCQVFLSHFRIWQFEEPRRSSSSSVDSCIASCHCLALCSELNRALKVTRSWEFRHVFSSRCPHRFFSVFFFEKKPFNLFPQKTGETVFWVSQTQTKMNFAPASGVSVRFNSCQRSVAKDHWDPLLTALMVLLKTTKFRSNCMASRKGRKKCKKGGTVLNSETVCTFCSKILKKKYKNVGLFGCSYILMTCQPLILDVPCKRPTCENCQSARSHCADFSNELMRMLCVADVGRKCFVVISS